MNEPIPESTEDGCAAVMGMNDVLGKAISSGTEHISFGTYNHMTCEYGYGITVNGAMHSDVIHCAMMITKDNGDGISCAIYESADVDEVEPENAHIVKFMKSVSIVVKASEGVDSKVG